MMIATVSTHDTPPARSTGFSQSAGTIVSQHERIVAAPVARIWNIHADVVQWPRWQRDIKDVRLDGPLVPGSAFRWWTMGMRRSRSTVYALQSERRTLWSNPAAGIQGLHEWRFDVEDENSTLIRVESWASVPVDEDEDAFAEDHGHTFDRWLDFLEHAATR